MVLVDFSVDCLGGYLVPIGKHPFLSESRMLHLVDICLMFSRLGEEAGDSSSGLFHVALLSTCEIR